ncbi:copper resistance protein NlpE [Sphingobacterium tabacisoli]|uniref:Copper resistance protein NlpE n=1 Tax=Sphingobacterium tabacisoli TaxID=2044855 RepID=A0ABW5L5J6_9SPHI|nr:copper resistance protein NlpE [Sphingobacterium tabacisoli]
MNKTISTIALCSILALAACNSNNTKNSNSTADSSKQNTLDTNALNPNHADYIGDAHNSKNSVDWMGTYKGTTPCADCPGIETTIKIYKDETFSYKALYQDRNLTVTDTGKFEWFDKDGSIQLKGKDTDIKYKVGENILIQLDTEGKEITGTLADKYILKKDQ